MRFTTPLSFSVLTASLALAACGNTQSDAISSTQDPNASTSEPAIIQAEPQSYMGGIVTAWSNLASEEIGFTLPLAVIQNAPTTLPEGADPHVPNPSNSVRIDLPPQVKAATFLDHIDIDYNPVGHDPLPIYSAPHFDFHFYGISAAEQAEIDCTDTSTVAKNRLPANHILAKNGLLPAGECVPHMGLHAVDAASPEVQPQNPQPFTKTMILGYYQGRLTFVEPMITREYLLQKQDFTQEIKLPEVVARNTLMPTKFTADFNEDTQEYRFTLSDFVEVE